MNATEGRDERPAPTVGKGPVTAELLGEGRYRLGTLLGAGGMGLVRRATDEVLHREVAIKLLADNLAADPDARERFLREARAAARVGDPHVVAVHDVGEHNGRPYLVMELVDGPSLADVLAADGPLDPQDVVGIAAQALAGLAAAHGAGLLHRDVKPGNLLRGSDDRVRVADFGVAEAADVPGLTRTGFVLGTRSYLAPERRRGAVASVATDLYALGATLAELLTGHPPGDERPALPVTTPATLERLVLALLAADPTQRPTSAETALDLLAGGTGTTAERAAAAVDDTANVAVPPPTEPLSDLAAGEPTPRLVASGGVRDWRSHGWLAVLAIGLLLLLVGAYARFADGGEQTPTTEETPEDTGGDASPADEARDLARWLREQAGD